MVEDATDTCVRVILPTGHQIGNRLWHRFEAILRIRSHRAEEIYEFFYIFVVGKKRTPGGCRTHQVFVE